MDSYIYASGRRVARETTRFCGRSVYRYEVASLILSALSVLDSSALSARGQGLQFPVQSASVKLVSAHNVDRILCSGYVDQKCFGWSCKSPVSFLFFSPFFFFFFSIFSSSLFHFFSCLHKKIKKIKIKVGRISVLQSCKPYYLHSCFNRHVIVLCCVQYTLLCPTHFA